MNLIETYKKSPHSDKGTLHSYIEYYNQLFEPYKDKKINFLEIGLFFGHSIDFWDKYFNPESNILSIDIDLKLSNYNFSNRVTLIQGDSTKLKTSKLFKNSSLNIIIDDGDHSIGNQIKTFNNFKSKMAKGGLYIIEDIQNIDKDKQSLLDLHKNCKVYDLRHLKGRYDDVFILYKF